MILEGVANHETWIWHAFLDMAGSYNGINVLQRSPVFAKLQVKLRGCKTACNAWQTIRMLCEGSTMAKKNKVDAAKRKFTMFAQKANESIESLDLRFAEILNELEALGEMDAYSESDKALAIIRSLNDQWSMQKASYQTHNTHNTESYISILETLKNVENEKVLNSSSQAETGITELALAADQPKLTKSTKAAKAKESKAVKPSQSSDKSADIDAKLEEMALVMKSMKRFMKKGYRAERSSRGQGSKDQTDKGKKHQSDDEESDQPDKVKYKADFDKSKLLCFHCAKPGHFKADCPQLAKYGGKNDDRKYQRQQRRERKSLVAQREADLKAKLKELKEVKAYIADHDSDSDEDSDSDSDSDELNESALICDEGSQPDCEDELCLMAIDDTEVTVTEYSSSSESEACSNESFAQANEEEMFLKIQILNSSLEESVNVASTLMKKNTKLSEKCESLTTENLSLLNHGSLIFS